MEIVWLKTCNKAPQTNKQQKLVSEIHVHRQDEPKD